MSKTPPSTDGGVFRTSRSFVPIIGYCVI